ncbi:MAG: M56 family metallopeptidase [Lachnospiraceae bacterium]|nr:M56 family metallopeptidase [Lachnospiraceae bacterium]
MKFSFQTVYTTILVTNILILFVASVLNNLKIITQSGYKIALSGIILIILRFAFPLEFFFTRNLPLPKFFSFFIAKILHPYWGTVCIWHILMVIWGIGIAYNLLRYVRGYINLMHFIHTQSDNVTDTEKYQKAIKQIGAYKKGQKFSVYESADIYSPMICGIFHPRILLPKYLSLSDTDLELILRHEISHYYHKDLLLKMIMELICIAYWWNPICKILKRQINIILELRIDHELSIASAEQKLAYYNCLLDTARYSVNETSYSPHIIYFCRNSRSILYHRIEIGLHASQRQYKTLKILVTVLLIATYIISYLFVLEPIYVSPENEKITVGTMSPEFYYIVNDSGTYDIYYQGKHIETADSLKYYYGIRQFEEGD